MINEKYRVIFGDSIKIVENLISHPPPIYKDIFPAMAESMTKNLITFEEQMHAACESYSPDLVSLFVVIKKIDGLGKRNKDLITLELKEVLGYVREFIDENTDEFENQFIKKFTEHFETRLEAKIELTEFPNFLINRRYDVAFKFGKSNALLDDSVTINSIDPESVAIAASDHYKKLWIDNEDIKNTSKSIKKYYEAYKKLILQENKPFGEYVSIFDFHKFVFIDKQSALFWRECRPELIKAFTIGHTRAVLSKMIAEGTRTEDGYVIKLAPVRDNVKDAVAIYSSIEKNLKYYGLIAFFREEQ